MTHEKHAATQDVANPSRRNFLKIGGATAVAASVAGAIGAGFQLGRDPDSYVGWGRTEEGKDMFFDRDSFRVDYPPTFRKVAEIERPEWASHLFNRTGSFRNAFNEGWTPDMGLETFPDERIRVYYRDMPDRFEEMLRAFRENESRKANIERLRDQFAIGWAYDCAHEKAAYGTHDHPIKFPKPPEGPPEVADYYFVDPTRKKLDFKSPQHASELVKTMAHQFGASLVGITGIHKEFIFKNMMRGVESWGDEVPAHWKSIIVIGIPMNWDPMYSAIGYSTSYDAYHKCRLAIGKLQIFLGELGYGSRCQVPGNDYEMTIPPLGVLAGLGEASRNGTLMTPELGTNIRLAALVTDIDLEHDKPVDLGMQHFCQDCKICATSCPSGSISLSDKPDTVIRGFKRYDFNQDSCYRMWQSGPTAMGMGCRACIAVCPYTRKNNWIHTIVREADPRDKTGLTRTALLAMQHNMFYYPEAEAYHGDWNGGHMAGYHQPPEWMRTENFFNVDKTWHYDGNWEGI
ncbi:4Fe-4S dicluster domain-containing protein [Photobacterium japonica]|uniref:4Fe-4S dicluster domain-containing protein n=1 Tax=Photobacterium japonica TaxID=2910235 RepID=UPI003D0D8038